MSGSKSSRRDFLRIASGVVGLAVGAGAGDLYGKSPWPSLLKNPIPHASAAEVGVASGEFYDVEGFVNGIENCLGTPSDINQRNYVIANITTTSATTPYRPKIAVPDLTKAYVPKDAFIWDDAIKMGNIDPGVYPPSKVYPGDKNWDESKVDQNLKLEGVVKFKKDCNNSKLLVQAELFRSVEYIRKYCNCFAFNISFDQFHTMKKDPDEKYWSIAYSPDFAPCLAYAHAGWFPKEHPYKNVKAEYELWVGKSPDCDIDHHILQAAFDLTDEEVELPLADKSLVPPLSFNSNHHVVGVEVRAGFYKKDLWQPLLDELPIKRLYWPIRSDATNWADLSLVNPNIVCKTSTTTMTTEKKTSTAASTSTQSSTSTPATQLNTSTQTACPLATAEPVYTVPKSTIDIVTAAIAGGITTGALCVGVRKLRNKLQKPPAT